MKSRQLTGIAVISAVAAMIFIATLFISCFASLEMPGERALTVMVLAAERPHALPNFVSSAGCD